MSDDPKNKEYPSSDDAYFSDSDGYSDEENLVPQPLPVPQPVAPAETPTPSSETTSLVESKPKEEESLDPIEIVNSVLPLGYSISHPPPTISEISAVSSSPSVVAHLNAIQNISLTDVTPITKGDPEHTLLLSSVELIIQIELERDRIFGILLQVYGTIFPELENLLLEKDDYVAAAGLCGTHFLEEPTTDSDFDVQDDIIRRLGAILPSQQVALVVALASVTKGPGDRSAEDIDDTNAFLASAAEEMKLLEEIKQIFLDHLFQRVHLYLPNLSNLVGPAITAQLFGILSGKVEMLTTMTREDVMQLGVKYQQTRQTTEDSTGMQAGYIVNCDLALFAKQNPAMDAYTVHKVVKAVANKVVLAARVDVGRYAPDGEKGFNMKKQVIRRINRLEKDISDKEQKRMQNFMNRQKLMDDIRAHREEMRLNRQVYGKDSTEDTERAFELWKNVRMQEASQSNATLYSQNQGRMAMKQHGRHMQLTEATAAARAAGMSLPEYEQHKRQLEKQEHAEQKKGFRRPHGGIWRKR